MGDFKGSVTAAAINLADDALWKKIQKNTFTRWCNEHLKSVELQIGDLKFDLSDGLILISLLEVLSHKRMFRKYHTRPTFRQLKLDNVSVALEFLDHEKVKLVSIDSKAIVDGNLKLILGLVWTLIQHYSISTPMWEDEANNSVSKLTPEMRLLGWIQNKVPELPITNFSQDWQDGKALGALVDGLAPGLCPDWESWDTVHRVSNTKEAMQQADDWLGIPQLIAPEEILDPAVDEQSVMTYLSLFPKARLKPGAPLKPKKVLKPKACHATGQGLQSKGMRVGQLAQFKVDTHKAGPGNLEVNIRDPSGKEVAVTQKDAHEGVYTFEYTPTATGDHTVDITWVGQHIAKSPFKVHVGSKAGPQKIRAWGPGLEGGTVGLSADFLVESVGADSGMLGFAIEGPSQAKIECDDHNDGSCLVRFWPTEAGEYAVHIMCDDEEIQDSPFMTSIRPKRKDFRPDQVKVEGQGVSQTGCILNLQTEFTVDTRRAGEGELKVYARRADGEFVDVIVASEQSGVFVCSYIPSSLSKHTIAVAWEGVMVPGSPFIVTPRRIKITPCSPVLFKPDGSEMYYSDDEMDLDEDFPENVRPGGHGELVMNIVSPSNIQADATKVRAHGPGLKEGFLGEQAEFIIDTSRAGSGRLAIRVDGPCEVTLQCLDNQDGTCTVFYLPTEHGMYKINVLFDNSHITGSPFQSVIQKPIDPSKVLVTDLDLLQGKVGEPCIVNINCPMAGSGAPSVQAVSDSGVIVQTEVKENEDGTYTAVYVPLTAGVYTLLLKYGGKEVPFRKVMVNPKVYKSHVKVSRQGVVVSDWETDTCQVVANGLGLQKGLTGHPNVFRVNARSSVDDLDITVEGPSECQVTCKDSGEGMYNVEYYPSVPGDYKITITCGENHIPGSPFIASVKDVSSTADSGVCLQSGICVSSNTDTHVPEIKYSGDEIYRSSPPPSMEDTDSFIDPQRPCGSSSPIQFQVLPNCDRNTELPSSRGGNMAKVIIPGIKGGVCGRTPQSFTIDCSSSGETPGTVAVVRPDGSIELLEVTDSGDGSYTVVYLPTMDGCHVLMVKFTNDESFHRCDMNNSHQPSSSCKHQGFQNKVEGRNVIPLGAINQAGFLSCDIVLPSELSEGEITGEVITPSGKTAQPSVIDNKDGTIILKFDPSEEGLHQLFIKSSRNDLPELPLQYYANSLANRSTMAYGRGLVYGIANETATFTICQEDSASSELDITIEGPSEADVRCVDNEDGTCTVSYFPTEPGDYEIQIQTDDVPIRGSPFKSRIADGNVRRSQVKLGSAVDFTLDITEKDISQLSASIMSPAGNNVPCLLKTQPDSHLGVSFIPREAGEHLVSIMKDGEHVNNSPISLSISQAEIGDTSKVKAFGPGLHTGQTFCTSEFVVDTWDAGYGGLTIVIEGPSKVDVHTEELEHGTCNISYCPIKAGNYKIAIKFSDEHIPGSPFTAVVTDRRLMRENITYNQKAAPIASIGSECSLAFKIPGTDAETLSAYVHEPSGRPGEAVIVSTGSDTYAVSFLAKEMGVYNVTVNNQDQTIPGWPLQYTVGPLGQGGCEKVQVWGQGLQKALASVPADFNIWSHEAGAGTLSVSVEGPGKIELHFDDQLDGSCIVSYTAQEPGDYEVSVMFDEEHVSQSPFYVSVSAATDKSLTQGQNCSAIDHNQMCDSYEEPSLSDMEINTTSDSSAETVFLSDASKVICHGPGLSKSFLGRKNTFYVDCSKAGRNLLFVGMHGPTIPCERVSIIHMGGHQYRITYAVKERGKYILAVKWGDEHIPGSPFHITVL
ncbi:filamin-A [Sinocyclocheilus anshuiensis]|uniref:filamin-A n=1 Tax=Sinocyclocheilus anshuiensis TaxID=1608454 RepID=UPI0007BAB52F|nr:PREDICTED: filamin-A-like [Sinocyclocheilus anshuiensis]